MNTTEAEMMMAVQYLKSAVKPGLPLPERLGEVAEYALEHNSEVFWMSHGVNDDFRFRAVVGAVLMQANEDEKDRIMRSMKPLQALSAAVAGVPVDFGQLELAEDLLPLLGIYKDAKGRVESRLALALLRGSKP